ncbi:MAG: hypothetical protein LBB23_04510 [Rickettsiales bacterium]|nr:hypothetical protein [Rickettsiales bacterium]
MSDKARRKWIYTIYPGLRGDDEGERLRGRKILLPLPRPLRVHPFASEGDY